MIYIGKETPYQRNERKTREAREAWKRSLREEAFTPKARRTKKKSASTPPRPKKMAAGAAR